MLKSKKNICVLGGTDDLTNSFYLSCKKKFNKTIYIKFSDKKNNKKSDKNIYYLHLYELKKCLNILKKNNIDEIVLLGKISRPDLSKFKLDGMIDRYLDKLINAYKKGDGEILNIVISIFNENGYEIVPITHLTSDFSFSKDDKNILFNRNDSDKNDIDKALKILSDLSKYDNAQSIVLDNGFILGIEAAEGTDEMLDKVYNYKKKLGLNNISRGILVKLPKKNQSLKVDLPVIGPKTIKLLKKSKINSLAINREHTLVNKIDRTVKEIEKNKINLYLI
tara:strand:+ start:358 stop:1194 length:837 start_codon:yes stop_codon:yes gene_type:complete